jgi:hypothetical protein
MVAKCQLGNEGCLFWHPSSERKVLYTFDPSFPRCFYRESCLTYEIPDKNPSGMTSNCQPPMKDAYFFALFIVN